METEKRGRGEPNPTKVETVKKLAEQLERAKAIYLTDFTGLNVELMTRLRREFRQEKADYIVGKKSLTQLALKDAGYAELVSKLEGSVGLAIGFDDPAAPARIITKFAAETEKLPVRGGIFEGRLIGAKDMDAIRNLPTRKEAIALLVNAMGGPLQSFVGVLNGVLQNFLGVLDAIIEKKRSTGAPEQTEGAPSPTPASS
jgi:large subunit ribosomal protein L10